MDGPGADVCEVVGCGSVATGSYLSATRVPATRFAVCDLHVAQLIGGGQAVVLDADPGTPPLLVID